MLFRSAKLRLMGASAAALTASLCVTPSMAQTAPDAGAPAAVPPTAASDSAATSEIVVTGSRLTNSGFAAPTPVTVVGAAEIARQGATNVVEVLDQVPAFRAQNTPATSANSASNLGTSAADLRGLGANRTLVLINGRRVVASTVQGGSTTPANVVDLAMVPTSLIERSEVVTGGASAQYGSDAVAGVVNIILNTKLEGFRGSVQYGQTDQNDAKDYAASLGFGLKLGDRGRLIVGGDFNNNKGMGDCYTRSWCAVSNNQVTAPIANRVNGYAAINILPDSRTATQTFNGIINSGPLSGLEFSPDGQNLVRHNYGVYFFNSGLFQAGGGDAQNAFYQNFSLYTPIKRYSTFAHAEYDLTDGISAFAEGSYAWVHGVAPTTQTRDTTITIQRDNAFLPASALGAMFANNVTNFSFGRVGQDLGAGIGDVHRETYRFVGGLDGKIAGGLKWNVYYQYGRTNYNQKTFNDRINDNFTRAVDAVYYNPTTNAIFTPTVAASTPPAGYQIACRSLVPGSSTYNPTVAAGCSPLNLFGQNHFSPAAKAYTYGTAIQETHITQNVVAATLSGNLVDLWAGPLSFAVGGEFRKDEANGSADPLSLALPVSRFYVNSGAPISGHINVKEGFVELGLPIARDLAFAHALDLNGALRVTDYSTSGSVTSWKAGVTYEPISAVRFRATRSRDIRAPNVFELNGPALPSFQSVVDPFRQAANSLPTVVNQGNPALKPETADTLTIGGVLQPDFWGLNRLRISVDYYDIKLKDAIAALGGQLIVNNCRAGDASSCALITRGPGDAINPAAGVLQSIVNKLYNLNQVHTEGLDFELSYSTPLSDVFSGASGTLSARVLATKVMHLTTTDATGTSVDRAGQNGSAVSQTSGVPRWQGSYYLTYATGPFSATMQFRYISSGVRDKTLIGPEDPRYASLLTAATCPAPLSGSCTTNRNHVPAYTYMNINAQYTIINDGRKKVELFGVVNNLFNTDPPNYLSSSFGATNNVLYDVLGRTYRIGVRAAF